MQKLVPLRSLILPFEPFRFWLRIGGDIRKRKTTPRLGKSGSRWLSDSASRGVVDSSTRRFRESAFECLKETRRLSRCSNLLKFFSTFKWLNQPFKGCNVLSSIGRQSCRLPGSASRGVVFRLGISPQIRKCSVRDLSQTDLCKNPWKSASLAFPFKN